MNKEIQLSIQRERLTRKKWDIEKMEETQLEYMELKCKVRREVAKVKWKAYYKLSERLDTKEGDSFGTGIELGRMWSSLGLLMTVMEMYCVNEKIVLR